MTERHTCCCCISRILDLFPIVDKVNQIMTTLAELTGVLQAVDAKLDKASAEILANIQSLKDALANVSLPADAETALATLQTQAQALDDIVPDVVPAPEPTPESTPTAAGYR